MEAAYGSAKDISVYSSLGLKPEQIFIVGKANKKQAAAAQVLNSRSYCRFFINLPSFYRY